MDREQQYRDAVSHALAGFQLVEEALKDYIGIYHEAVRRLLPSTITYGSSRKDIQDAALGKLINVFAKSCGDQALITELRSLISTRDELAHRALLTLYGSAQEPSDLAERSAALQKFAEQISGLLGQINKEMLKVLVASGIAMGAPQGR